MPALNSLRSVFKRIFAREAAELGPWQIIKWWELRRITYNLAVGFAGLGGLLMIGLLWPAASAAGPDDDSSPLLLGLGVVFYGIGANICYTGGWICELLLWKIWAVRTPRFSEIAMQLGFAFSILLTLTPSFFLSALLVCQKIFS